MIAIEATGQSAPAVGQPSWSVAILARYGCSLRRRRKAARTQLGSGRFKTDDRDCAALTYMARQGGGSARTAEQSSVEALRAAVRHRRGLVADRKVAQQRLHDQLNALCPGLVGAGRARAGLAVGDARPVRRCWRARRPSPGGHRQPRSLMCRAPGRLTAADCRATGPQRWRGCLPPPPTPTCAPNGWRRDLDRYRRCAPTSRALDAEIDGPAGRHRRPDPDHPARCRGRSAPRPSPRTACPSTASPMPNISTPPPGLAPALYQSATLNRRGRISRQGLAEHRDALMGIAWGLSQYSPSFADRDAEFRARGMAPIQARVALARHACRLAYRLLRTQQPFDEQRYRRGRLSRER